MTKILVENINLMYKYRSKIFISLIFSIIFLTFSYIFIVHSTIVNIVEREKIVKDIRDKSTLVSELESQYFSIKNNINIDLAHAKGFENSDISLFIPQKSITAFVSHNEF